jgi:hypothetical protein
VRSESSGDRLTGGDAVDPDNVRLGDATTAAPEGASLALLVPVMLDPGAIHRRRIA